MDSETPNITPHSRHFRHSMHSALNVLSSILFYFSILFFIIGFNISDTPAPGFWYQQFMPNIGSRQISDIFFIDSLTGYAVTNNLTPSDTGYILKTTNAGDNWSVNLLINRNFSTVKFINNTTGFACGGSGGGTPYLYKTTNSGANWLVIITPFTAYWDNMYVLNEDTIWLVDANSVNGGVFFTSNGGASWIQQLNIFANNPDRIYMFNARIGFVSRTSSLQLRKTTDGGQTWNVVTGTGTGSFRDMFFTDSLTGWKAKTVGGGGWIMGKTTDGGFNWANQQLPTGGNIIVENMERFNNVNKDTIFGVGAWILYPGNGNRGMIYKTTNGGDTWKFQIPDTSINIGQYDYIHFINRLNGWAYSTLPFGVHTVRGGDTTNYLPVHQISSNVPKEFALFQNYPNPFNPKTNIKYQIVNSKSVTGGKMSNVKLAVYDIQGRETATLVNEKQSAGTYEVEFNGTNYSSGVYFYSLIVNGVLIDTKKLILIK
jgi:photosystem II stability/assembly factor-like uncharacterized protein